MAIINIIAGTAGTIDGVIETGMSINDCNSDKWDVIASAGTTVANFASIFKILQISGGKAAMDITLYNAARKRSIGLNEIYGAGAAIAGLVGMAPLAVVLSVGGLLLTLNDFFGKGGRNNNCYDPNSPEAQLAGIIPACFGLLQGIQSLRIAELRLLHRTFSLGKILLLASLDFRGV